MVERMAVAPEIVSQMEDCLKGMEITPVDTSTYKGGEGAESLSLLSTATFDHLFPESRPGGVNNAIDFNMFFTFFPKRFSVGAWWGYTSLLSSKVL